MEEKIGKVILDTTCYPGKDPVSYTHLQAWTAGTGISENICGTAETGIRRRNTTEYCKSAVSSDQ